MNRRGLTLLELLTTVAIIGVLVALLLPAIQGVRSAAAKLGCSANLKQLGIALHQYHDAFKRFPAGRGAPLPFAYSVHAKLTPWIEQESVTTAINFSLPPTNIAVANGPNFDGTQNSAAAYLLIRTFLCPADPIGDRVPGLKFGSTSYAGNTGTGITDAGSIVKSDGVFFLGSGVAFRDLIDGASQTAAFSERLIGPGQPTSHSYKFYILERPPGADPNLQDCQSALGTWNADRGGKWILGNYGNTLYNHFYLPNSAEQECMNIQQQKALSSASSAHPGGVSVLTCDGSVRFVADGVSIDLWHGLATRGGGELSIAP